jgi:hypothetical protein
MAFTKEQLEQVTELMERYVEDNRPPMNSRHQVDLCWRHERQSIVVYEKRNYSNNPDEAIAADVAKATWIQQGKEWQIYWRRSNGKWERYKPLETVVNLQRFIIELQKDPVNCFWG